MQAIDLGVGRVDAALRLVRALGAHRYNAGRTHLVHAAAIAAVGDDAGGALAEALAWSRATLALTDLDAASRDERLWRRSTEAEVAAVLDAFWTPSTRADAARAALTKFLAEHELPVGDHAPFDESAEDGVHPLVIDAGWELVPLGELDPERHKGAIAAFGDDLFFDAAVFEEETAIPREPCLLELPAIGAVELLRGARDDGALAEPLVLWMQGNETYVDYLLRGVCRAAKIDLEEDA